MMIKRMWSFKPSMSQKHYAARLTTLILLLIPSGDPVGGGTLNGRVSDLPPRSSAEF